MQGLGDAPIEQQYRDKMNELAKLIDQFFNGNTKGKDRIYSPGVSVRQPGWSMQLHQ